MVLDAGDRDEVERVRVPAGEDEPGVGDDEVAAPHPTGRVAEHDRAPRARHFAPLEVVTDPQPAQADTPLHPSIIRARADFVILNVCQHSWSDRPGKWKRDSGSVL
jgi:hypothetical protein